MKIGLASIIIPAYNSASYVKEAIDSALAQTYAPIEIVVVDDGSTDNTKEVIAPYVTEKKIRYVYQTNKGLAGARNTGIKNSEGEFIAFLDADDIFLPQKLEKQVGYLKSHPDCDVSYCDIWHFYEETPDKLLKLNYEYFSGREVFPNLLKKNFINPLSVVMRRSIVERCGYFNENLRRSEDWEYWIRLVWQKINFCFLKEKLAKYRVRKASLSYGASSEIERKATTVGIFENLKKQMTAEDREKYTIDRIIRYHKAKLLYAKLESRFGFLGRLRYWLQERRLR